MPAVAKVMKSGAEAEAGILGWQQAKERRPRAKACGRDKPQSCSVAPSSWPLSEERRALRMSSEMKGWL